MTAFRIASMMAGVTESCKRSARFQIELQK
jgi:hypothetical protein